MQPFGSRLAFKWLWVAFLGASATVLGAYSAHGTAGLSEAQHASLETAVRYQQFYSLLLFVVVAIEAFARHPLPWVFRCWSLGVTAFSGSIYLLIATPWHWVWPVTPIGGSVLIIGWCALGVSGWRQAEAQANTPVR